jgi:GNAT superfamily N-acetyltransferase
MIRYLAFLNTDAPALVEFWNRQTGRRALTQPMTLVLLEECVFSKPYFDRHGLLVAKEDDRLVGFAHAGFAASADGMRLNAEAGAVNLVLVAEHPQREQIARGLLEASESYLIDRGVRTLWAGCVQPAHGFYLGLYGGSESPGVLESDADSLALFRNAGYAEVEQHAILQRQLASFRPPVDRQQVQIRRRYHVESEVNPPSASCLEAWTMEPFDRVRHRLFKHGAGEACGSVMTRCRGSLSGNSGASILSLDGLHVPAEQRGQGLGAFLLAEALRSAQESGAALAEVQVPQSNPPALALFKKLGFQQVDRGWVLRKTSDSHPDRGCHRLV